MTPGISLANYITFPAYLPLLITSLPTVYLLKLDTSIFLNNSINTHRRPPKPFAMCNRDYGLEKNQ